MMSRRCIQEEPQLGAAPSMSLKDAGSLGSKSCPNFPGQSFACSPAFSAFDAADHELASGCAVRLLSTCSGFCLVFLGLSGGPLPFELEPGGMTGVGSDPGKIVTAATNPAAASPI